MPVLLALLAAQLVGSLSARPADLAPAGQAGAYQAWFLERTAELSRMHATAACAAPVIRSRAFRLSSSAHVLRSPGQEAELDGPFYRESYVVEGCGPMALQNMAVAHKRGGGWRGVGTLPGATLADMRLQNDASMMAVTAVLTKPAPGCDTARARTTLKIVDTVLTSPAPTSASMPWTERWMFTTCGASVPVEMTFTPTPGQGGVAFSARRG